jgi:preprotein translocase subunit SecF
MTRLGTLGHRLYAGEVSYDFIGRRKIWYAAALSLIAISFLALLLRGGFNLGIEFRGGASFQFPANGHSVAEARDAAKAGGAQDAIVTTVGKDIRVQTEPLTEPQVAQVSQALASRIGVSENQLNPSTVGAAWGSQITAKALRGLIAFLVLVIIYISYRFEPRMAAAGILALLHDLIITAGIYAVTGFEVTPATVIALLTILGYSLYDTVVVFDKVQENTRGLAGSSRMTYSQAANRAVNQTLARSINTSVIALLPVAGLLFVGAGLLHASTLKDLSLALFVGLAAGAYSSIFLATPLLADLKEREPQFKALAARVAARERAGRPTGARATGGEARAGAGAPSQRAAATAVLDPPPGTAGPAAAEELPASADKAAAGGPSAPTNSSAGTRGSGARQGARPMPPRRGKGGRGGRPSGKRRR